MTERRPRPTGAWKPLVYVLVGFGAPFLILIALVNLI